MDRGERKAFKIRANGLTIECCMAIDLSKLYQKSSPLSMTARDRQKASILLVEPDAGIRNTLRQMLVSLDYGQIADAPDHLTALKKIEERQFSHLIFDARKTNIPIREFLASALEYDNRMIAIPSSYLPTVDDVFDLLIAGARAYLVKPFTTGGVDEALVWATKGEPISDAILYAKNRNEALAALIMSAQSKLAITMRQAELFDTAKRELPRRQAALQRASEIARTFAQGGEEALLDAMVEYAASRSEGPATRLGRLRKVLNGRKLSRREEAAKEEPADSNGVAAG